MSTKSPIKIEWEEDIKNTAKESGYTYNSLCVVEGIVISNGKLIGRNILKLESQSENNYPKHWTSIYVLPTQQWEVERCMHLVLLESTSSIFGGGPGCQGFNHNRPAHWQPGSTGPGGLNLNPASKPCQHWGFGWHHGRRRGRCRLSSSQTVMCNLTYIIWYTLSTSTLVV